MRRERLIGGIVGIFLLASVFLLPFSSAISVTSDSQDTLYNIFNLFVMNASSIPGLANTALELIAYIFLAGTILLLAAGILGSFPLASGALGVGAMVILTLSGGLTPQYTPAPLTYGAGYYLIWALALVQLAGPILLKRMKASKSSDKGAEEPPTNQSIPTSTGQEASNGAQLGAPPIRGKVF